VTARRKREVKLYMSIKTGTGREKFREGRPKGKIRKGATNVAFGRIEEGQKDAAKLKKERWEKTQFARGSWDKNMPRENRYKLRRQGAESWGYWGEGGSLGKEMLPWTKHRHQHQERDY